MLLYSHTLADSVKFLAMTRTRWTIEALIRMFSNSLLKCADFGRPSYPCDLMICCRMYCNNLSLEFTPIQSKQCSISADTLTVSPLKHKG